MQKNSELGGKRRQKDVIIAEMRQKPGFSQAIFVKLSGVSGLDYNLMHLLLHLPNLRVKNPRERSAGLSGGPGKNRTCI